MCLTSARVPNSFEVWVGGGGRVCAPVGVGASGARCLCAQLGGAGQGAGRAALRAAVRLPRGLPGRLLHRPRSLLHRTELWGFFVVLLFVCFACVLH